MKFNEPRFTADELSHTHRKLIELEANLRDEIEEIRHNKDEIVGVKVEELSQIHPGDRGSLEFDEELSFHSYERVKRRLRDVVDAQIRVQKGDYGLCENCGEEIAKARLDVMPEARLCNDCQHRLESTDKNQQHFPQRFDI